MASESVANNDLNVTLVVAANTFLPYTPSIVIYRWRITHSSRYLSDKNSLMVAP